MPNFHMVDRIGAPPLTLDSMPHLNAIAADRTAHLWWRGWTFAARWRD